jgi:Sulfotransferase family
MTIPIFLLGIFERSGTNYVWDLIHAHPDCGARRPIWEDKLLRPANMLVDYVDSVIDLWDQNWGVPPHERDRLLRSLGAGLEHFVTTDVTTPYVIMKTPSVDNLPLFFDLHPDSPLIVLVRDGRSVTESGVRSFGWSYPMTMKIWADAGRTVLDCDPAFKAAGRRYRLVRYEDVVADVRGQLPGLLEFCGLDPARYDFDAAEKTPVRGSSTVRTEEGGPVAWDKVERPPDFDPLRRFAGWEAALWHLYAELAGDVAVGLGYEVGDLPPLDAAARLRLVRYRAELAREIGLRKGRRYARQLQRAARRPRHR